MPAVRLREKEPCSMNTGSCSSDEMPGSSTDTYVTQTSTDQTGNESSISNHRPCMKKARYT